ncbi:PAS domain S-box protein [Brevundimonas sp. SORGH_AS_0993]|uniref:PAS domain S-box protein n=1 Tax=Brevundimonas sp. SORGH_AS_0993 TaxID=3041794 RepID=UPI0027824BC0|nr:PAS domain S-box protein [Brevundimonas sp. SORGH_AS_0993]MDQ1155389.1 PAS domain S-box-containing protein [Brevundimonas sp. SORGH_AS_0993]
MCGFYCPMPQMRAHVPLRESRQTSDLASPFDRLTHLACNIFCTPHAMVSIVDGERTEFHCHTGPGRDALPCEMTLSPEMMAQGADAVMMVEDGRTDPRTRDHPMVVGPPYLRFFAGVTIVDRFDRAVGAIGVMDSRPRKALSQREVETLRMLGRMASEVFAQADSVRRQSEQLELMRLTEELAGVGQWRVDVKTRRILWSDEIYRIFGLDRATFHPTVDEILTLYVEEDRGVLEAALGRCLNEGVGYKLRSRVRRADGEIRVLEAQADCERGPDGEGAAVFGVLRDVTDEEDSKKQLAESEDRYRLLADRSSDLVLCHRVDGTLTYVSPSIARFGMKREEVVGQSLLKFVHPDDRPLLLNHLVVYLTSGAKGDMPPVRFRAQRPDGSVLWVESRVSSIRDADGRVVEFQNQCRDVTETKGLEDALTQARDRAEAASRAKSEFLANMSHELRTPLTSVIGFAGLLNDSAELGPRDRDRVRKIAAASESLLAVINDILDYSKLEAGAVRLDPQPFRPRDLAETTAGIVEGQCEAKGLSLRVEVDPAVPEALNGDAGRLRQVTLNFLSNAVKFTAEGEVALHLSLAEGRLRIAVRDSGIGLTPEVAETLFDRFMQADASTTRQYGGTGLGLAISRRLAEVMGGAVGVDSKMGEGSVFWIEVPLEIADPAAVDVEAPEAAQGPTGALRVLMADDVAANRELMTAIMESLGVNLETATDGVEAVAAAKTGLYDLILMDLHMPNMDGLEASRRIRAMEGRVGRTPIVALTANVQPDQIEACRAAGMDAHVGKPIRPTELLTAINAVMAARPVETDAAAA